MMLAGLRSRCSTPLVVRRGQARRTAAARHLGGLVGRQPADAPQQRREVLALDVLHREERLAVGLADVVDAADVGMRHLPRDAHLVPESRQPTRLVASHRFGQELHRDGLAERQVLGAIDLAHPASAQQPDDAVAAPEESAGRKPPQEARVAARAGRAGLGRGWRPLGRPGRVAGSTVLAASAAVPNPVTALDSGSGAGVKTVGASGATGSPLPHSGQNLDRSGMSARHEGQVTRGFYQRG